MEYDIKVAALKKECDAQRKATGSYLKEGDLLVLRSAMTFLSFIKPTDPNYTDIKILIDACNKYIKIIENLEAQVDRQIFEHMKTMCNLNKHNYRLELDAPLVTTNGLKEAIQTYEANPIKKTLDSLGLLS